MEKFATENLILLEFLVDQLNLDYELQKDLESIMGDTCVSFQFLDNAPLYICEQDFTVKHPCAIRDQSNIKNGKSCLFSLTPQQADEATKQFDVYVEVFKKMKPGILPEKLPLGESLISIANLFKELIDSISENGESPSAKTLKDCFKITSNKGIDVGHISVYIRMSCFGKLIVTQFQMNLEDKSVQFRAKEGHYLFKYNKGKGEPGCDDYRKMQQSGGPPCVKPKQEEEEMCPLQPCIFQPQLPSPSPFGIPQQPTQMQSPCGICGVPQSSVGPQPSCGICWMPQPPSVIPQPPCVTPQQLGGTQGFEMPCVECNTVPPDPKAAYQEIGASIGGNALTIRVHKDKGKIEQVTDPSMADSDVCSCAMGHPKPSPIKCYPPLPPCTPRHTTYSSPPCCTMQKALSMRPGAPDPNSPFTFKMGGCGAGASDNVTVNPPHCVTKDGTCFTEISDPKKDVFVLRIGKKSEGVDKKNNLELELCTPKGPEYKPPPKKETRDTQYCETDVPGDGAEGAAKGGGAGKKKGGKDKKGGKGGKKGKKK